jgi:hypothetical protein
MVVVVAMLVVWFWMMMMLMMVAVDYSAIATCDESDVEHDQSTSHLRDQTLPM